MVFNRRNFVKYIIFAIICTASFNPSYSASYKVRSNGSVSTQSVQNVNKKYANSTSQNTQNLVYYKSFATGWNEQQENYAVNKIGTALVGASNIPANKQVKFLVVQKNEINAYTDQNNNVIVYKGILSYLEKEDELAFIIAHELGHVEQCHVIRGIFRSGILSVLASIISSTTKTGNLSGVAGNMAYKKFSRNDEFKADQRGMDFLVKVGYNPLAAISVLYKIGSNYMDIWADHPSTDKRITKDYQYIQKNYPQYIDKGFGTDSYQSALTQILKITEKKNTSKKVENL